MERAEAEAILDGDRETALTLLMRIDELIEANRRLEARVADLEQRRKRSSRNSSLPPSADPPSAAPRPRRPGSGRERGAQPGHKGRSRPLLALEQVAEVVDHGPSCRPGCRREPSARASRRRSPPSRCATASRGAIPQSSCASCLAPSSRPARSTPSCSTRARRSQSPTLSLQTRSAPPRPSTSTRPAGACAAASARFRGALTCRAAVFRIAEGRHRREAQALLGEDFSGVACSDRWWAYDYLDPERRQLCWAHLVRDFTAHSEGLGAQKEFGAAGLRVTGRLFAAWDECRWDADRARLSERIGPLQEELRALLEEAARKSTKTRYHRPFAKNLLKRWPALWSFASVPGVEPTNNPAERGLRGAVIYRKLSLGSQSEEGERTIERLLSASVTCRLQRRSLFAYLSDVLAARIRGDPIPLLT